MLDESHRGDESYVLPQRLILSPAGLRKLNRLSPGSVYDNWFHSRGAADPGVSVVKLVIEGNRPYQVQVTDMGVLERCGHALDGTLFSNAPGGGTVGDLGISFDLDLPRPFPQNGLLTGSWFQRHSVTLNMGESEVIEVVSTSARYCAYQLTLTVVDGTKTITEMVADHGKPFRVSGLLPWADYKALYVGGTQPGVFAPFVRKNPGRYQP